MDNIALVVNTHSSYGDLWEMFFDKKREHFPDIKTYVFSDSGDFEPEHTVVYYDRRKNFRSQFLSCIGSVQEEYCIFVSEDYILCDHPDEGLLTKYTNILEEHNLHIAGTNEDQQFEIAANKVCQHLDMRGLYSYHGEPKRGIYHHDSIVFPHIATAIIKGKWNLSEYPTELTPLLEKYNINPEVRGIH